VAEGVPTAKSAYMLAQHHQVDMPITQAVYDGLYLSQKPQEALWSILSRSLKADGV
jgi:glycerol-3-phosphate dehydrogenase (NAD(P)+)